MDFFPKGNVFHVWHGVKYAMPDWLPPLLPDEEELPLAAMPTFCGAGDGFGDWIVKDRICGIWVKIPCLIHDVGWATSKEEGEYFVRENWRFRYNLHSAVVPTVPWYRKPRALLTVYLYWLAVATIGQNHFAPCGEDWADNPVVREKLQRLSRAKLGIV